jgi:L-amino acid N-acyltransferase YncA
MRLRDATAEDLPAIAEIYDFADPTRESAQRERREMPIKDEARARAVGFPAGRPHTERKRGGA